MFKFFSIGGGGATPSSRLVHLGEPQRCGINDDLLTAGLGAAGLRAETLDDEASLRQRDVHRDFRELVDVTDAGGFGRLYGPKSLDRIAVTGTDTAALLQLEGRANPFAVRVLIPDDLDTDRPCLIVAPSSGSRGAMGSIGDIGAWALTHGHALALTDKGTGVGAHLLADDTLYNAHTLAPTKQPDDSLFAIPRTDALKRFRDQYPYAVGLKHLHARENLEADWPHCLIEATRFSKKLFGEHLAARGIGRRFKTIGVGVSNGGGAVLRAGELPDANLLDGLVAVEPNAVPAPADITIIDGGMRIKGGRDLYAVSSAMALLAPVAVLHGELADAPLSPFTAPLADSHRDWAARAAHVGLITGKTAAEQSLSALEQMRALGFQHETDGCLHAMVALQIWPAVTVGFAHMLGRFGVEEPLCGVTVSFADLGGGPARAPASLEREQLAAKCGGLAPSGGLDLIDRDGTAGLGFDTLLGFRDFWTAGGDEGARIRAGAGQVLASARPTGVPTMIVHGRGDSLINVNHTSRAYMAAAAGHGRDEMLRYYEVDHAQHFETLLMLPGFSDFHAPLAPAIEAALHDMMHHLWGRAPLPPSQRIRALPAVSANGGARGRLTRDHLGELKCSPSPVDRIEVTPGRIVLSDPEA